MKIKTKAWMASQGLLILTAVLIQLTFYREIKLGPLLGMTKRPYWEIISDRPPAIPEFVREKGLPPNLWDARLPLSGMKSGKRNLPVTGGPTGARWATDCVLRRMFGERFVLCGFPHLVLVFCQTN